MKQFVLIHRKIDSIENAAASDLALSFIDAKKVDLSEALGMGIYHPVAVLSSPSIFEIFLKTNHLDSPWYDNEIVRFADRTAASTSVGDIVVDMEEGSVQIYDSLGMIPVGDEHVGSFLEMAQTYVSACGL